MKTYRESSREVRPDRASRFKLDIRGLTQATNQLPGQVAIVDLGAPARYTQVTMPTFQAAVAGDVFLVRSNNVPYLGDHFFMVTGPLVEKPHGLRPQGVSVRASARESAELDNYQPVNNVIILRLNDKKDVVAFLNSYKLAHLVI